MKGGARAIKDADGVGDFWSTPFPLWGDILVRYFPTGVNVFDPCPNRARILPGTWITEMETDGLKIPWEAPFFINPPWSNIFPWIVKAIESNIYGVMLGPTRTDQPWFHLGGPVAKLVNIGGRVNYINPATGTTDVIDKETGKLKKGSISSPSSLLVFGGGQFGIVEYWTPFCHLERKTGVSRYQEKIPL